MKAIDLAEQLLKNMVLEYAKKGNKVFGIRYLENEFPEESHQKIEDALSLLKTDGLIRTQKVRQAIFVVTLSPEGIRNYKENPLFKRGYTLMEEIKSLL